MGFNKTAPNPSYERYKNILADTPEPEETKGPGFNRLMGAAFRTENVIGSYMAQERFDAPESYDPSYDPLTEDNLKGYEAFSDKFVDVYSPEQNEAMKLQLDREIADREIIARGGLGGVGAAMFAGTVDPTILIPVGGTIKKGESLLNIGLKSAYAATAGAGVSEVILHSTQETRTAEESAMAIGGATVLGGILGPTVVGGYRGLKGKPINGFDPIEYDDVVRRFENEMVYDPDGDLNASDPEMLARIRTDLEATGAYYGSALDTQATALEAMVTTLARRTGQSPAEFYEAQGPRLSEGGGFGVGTREDDSVSRRFAEAISAGDVGLERADPRAPDSLAKRAARYRGRDDAGPRYDAALAELVDRLGDDPQKQLQRLLEDAPTEQERGVYRDALDGLDDDNGVLNQLLGRAERYDPENLEDVADRVEAFEEAFAEYRTRIAPIFEGRNSVFIEGAFKQLEQLLDGTWGKTDFDRTDTIHGYQPGQPGTFYAKSLDMFDRYMKIIEPMELEDGPAKELFDEMINIAGRIEDTIGPASFVRNNPEVGDEIADLLDTLETAEDIIDPVWGQQYNELKPILKEMADHLQPDNAMKDVTIAAAKVRRNLDDMAEELLRDLPSDGQLDNRQRELVEATQDLLDFFEAEDGLRSYSRPPGVLFQAKIKGYEGSDAGEAREWLRAKAKGLDMSQEARMARAREMGFDTDTVLYHGTAGDFKEFDLEKAGKVEGRDEGMFFFTTERGKTNFYANQASRVTGKNPSIIPTMVRLRDPVTLDVAEWAGIIDDKNALAGGRSLEEIFESASSGYGRKTNKGNLFIEHAKMDGHDGVLIEHPEDGSLKLAIVFDPSNIRSVNAAFDPDFSDSANLLAQGQRGQFNTNTRELRLFDAADQSTLMHEASHWYLDTLFKIDGNEFVTKQLDEILNWHGTKRDEVFDGDGNLTSKGVELQEAFAESFEVYLQTGKAPTTRLQAAFDQFREWLSALYKALDPRKRANVTPEIKDVFDRMLAFEPGGTDRLDVQAMRNPQSVGAAAMAEPTLEDYALAPSLKTADATAALRLNPLTRMATADSAEVRQIAAQLMENGMYLGRNLEGKASPISVEQAMTEYRGWHAKAETAANKAYRALRKDKNTPNMTQRDFYEQVAYAMRRSDQSENPHIAAAASAYREAVEKTKQRAIQAGLLPEDVSVKTASSYFHRMWNRNALKRKPNEFKGMVRVWLNDTFESMRARASQVEFELAKLDAKATEADQKLLDQVKELEEIIETEGGLDGYAKTVADDIFDTLMGHDARLIDTGFSLVPNARGPLKERTFNIPDLFEANGAKVEDFLVNDAHEVMSRYMRVTAADIELTRAFGSPDLESPIEKIKADYRKQIEALPKGSEKEARRLTNQMYNRINDLNGVRDVIRGNYGEDNYDNMGARGAELVRAWNYMTMLGGMTVSALPDVGNKVIANGFVGMFRDMIGPLVTDIKGVKIAATEAKELGIAVEMALATRIASLADVGDMYGRGSQFERFVNGLSNRFTHATGMRLWNDIMKSGDYIAATNRAIRAMERPDRANKQAKAWLANLGIGEDDYKRIMAQYKKHGQKRHTMRLAHADKWDDAEAKRLWIGAMGKNANIQTVTPGAGDKMLVMNGDLGKTLGQFKSFAMAANQRVMIRGAQSARMGDARFVSGLATFVGMGMLVYYLKSELSGRKTSDDPATWVREGIDRSGILPLFMEVFNTTEKVTGTTLVGDSPASRYASRGAFASLLGPSVGRGEDAVSFLQGAFDGELKDRDLHAARKLLPFNNIFYLRRLLDEFEMKATEELDLEETSLSERRESMFAE